MLGLPFVLLSLVGAAWAATFEVDDRDSRIVYSGSWSPGGGSDESQGTTTYTLQGGATASFTFTGTAVTVIGTVDLALADPTGSSTYQLDGGTATTFNGTQAVPAGQRVTGQTFFSTAGLASSQHTIVITNLDGKLVIDKITYEAEDTTTPPTTDPVTTPPTDTTTAPGPTDTPTSDPASSTGPTGTSTTTPTRGATTPTTRATSSTSPKTTSSSTPNSSSSSSSSPPNLAVIVGSSVGGVAALALLFLGVVIIKKRRDPSSPSLEKIDLETHPTYPLMATPPPPPTSTGPYDPYTTISTPTPAPIPAPTPPNRDISVSAAPSQNSLTQPPVRPADELGYDTSLFSFLDQSAPRPTAQWNQGREGTPYG